MWPKVAGPVRVRVGPVYVKLLVTKSLLGPDLYAQRFAADDNS
jgi:hypothetical protein